MSIKSNILLRVRIAFLVCVLSGFAVIAKIVYIQTVQGEKWRKKAEKLSLRYKKLPATRGNIYANDGSLLATSLPFYKLAMDPKTPHDTTFNKGIDSLSLKLSRFFGDLSPQEYKRKIKNARLEKDEKYIVLNARILNFQEKKMIQKWPIFRAGRYKGGAIFEKQERRYHPYGNLLAYRTIGFINENNAGAGLEVSFNDILGGRDGEALFRKLAGGAWKPIHGENEILAEHGLDIKTTIDINLQDVAESSLLHHLTKNDAEYGCVMLMEVATGEIKAIANLGKSSKGGYFEAYNYAVGGQGLTDPGSTFKLATLMAIFEGSGLELDDSVECEHGSYRIYDRVLKDAKPEGYGTLSVKDIFAKSSNIGVAKLVQKYFGDNPQAYLKYIRSFGFDKPIGFQMSGEAMPYIKNPSEKSWSGITLPWMSIGYELKLSPIHTLTFYNAVANGGKMIKPIIVKEVYRSDKLIKSYETEVLNPKICSESTLEKVVQMMEEVVESGTAKNIKNDNYRIAGKTGTAQIIKKGLYTKNYYTSFCGFFPADKPKYSCIVVISEPKGFNQMGADVSAPVFKEMADKIYALDPEMHKQLEKPEKNIMFNFPVLRSGNAQDLKYLCNEFGISNYGGDDEWVMADISNNAITWRNRKMIQNLVPDVSGMMLKDALYILENKGLKVTFNGTGRVQSQSIGPGNKVYKGNTIFLKLG
ncbi:MAG: PASTA domain-containing protein [Bacteroidetes bacterium]|nr:MAG: PASTA domain-containing protein [Bacteroidota bacterium]